MCWPCSATARRPDAHPPFSTLTCCEQHDPHPRADNPMSQKSSYKVAMVGATGAVGETVLAILAEREFPVSELVPLASERSAGGKISFGGKDKIGRASCRERVCQYV